MRGHPVLGAISGLFFGIFLDALLVILSVLGSDNIALVIIPAAGLVLGIAWGIWAPWGAPRTGPPREQPVTVDTPPAGP